MRKNIKITIKIKLKEYNQIFKILLQIIIKNQIIKINNKNKKYQIKITDKYINILQ